jgi:DNA mismatch repair protein MutS2
MAFIDDATADRIGLNWVLGELRPLSPYGKLLKARMRLAGPGCEGWLAGEWQLVANLLAQWRQDLIQDIEWRLESVREIRGTVKRACQGYVLEDVDFFELKKFLDLSSQLLAGLKKIKSLPSRLTIPVPAALVSALAPGGTGEGFYLADSFSESLGKYRGEQRQLKARLSQLRRELQRKISGETGKLFNPVGRMRINKLDPLCKELENRKDLVVAAEGYAEMEFIVRDTDAMRELAAAIDELEEKIQAEEHKVRVSLSREVGRQHRLLLAACRRIGRIDLLLAKGRLARKIGGCVPEMLDQPQLVLEDFINPEVNSYLTREGRSFQPLSLCLLLPVTVITGANMGGKSIALRSAGLAAAMAQMGLLVPAKACRLSLREFVYYSQQEESPRQGLSTFGTEILGLARVLPLRGQRGLYLLDEPARGTNPWEGAALVKAIVDWLLTGNSITLVATHFPGLSEVDGIDHLQVAGLKGLNAKRQGIKAQDLKSLQQLMDYSLVPGKGEVPRDALRVAVFLGLAPEIVEKASKELGISPQEVLDK